MDIKFAFGDMGGSHSDMTIIVVPYKFNVYLYITREESTIIIICRDRNK